jgi:hypothetical protein
MSEFNDLKAGGKWRKKLAGLVDPAPPHSSQQ